MPNSSVINEIARTGSHPCRAKNPATCRVHGTFEPVAVITDSAAAKYNLRASEKFRVTATTLEDRIEAEMLVDKDQLLYDATIDGLKDLQSAIYAAKNNLEKQEIKNRRAIAREYRAKLLAENPVIQQLDQNFERILSNPAYKTYTPVKGYFDKEALTEMAKVTYGTPVIVKLKDGGYLLDTTGDGIQGGYDSLNAFTKLMVKPHSFVRGTEQNRPFAYLSLNNTGVMVEGNKVESVTIMPADTKIQPTSLLENIPTTESSVRSSGYRAIVGKDFAFVGDMTQGSYQTDKGSASYWQVNNVGVHARSSTVDQTVGIRLA